MPPSADFHRPSSAPKPILSKAETLLQSTTLEPRGKFLPLAVGHLGDIA